MTDTRPCWPEPQECTYLTARRAAEMLEALALDLEAKIGHAPPPEDGSHDLARWLGKRELLRYVQSRAVPYRDRLTEILEPPC